MVLRLTSRYTDMLARLSALRALALYGLYWRMSPLTRPCLYTSWLWSQHLTFQIVHIPHYDKHPVSYAQAWTQSMKTWKLVCRIAVHSSTCCYNDNPHFSINEMSYEPFLCYKLCWNVLLFLCNICYLRLLPLLIHTTLTHTSSDVRLPKSGIFPRNPKEVI